MIENTVKQILIERLNLHAGSEEIGNSAPLFAPVAAGGLELDSLASLEMVTALATHYKLPMDDVEPADFMSIGSIASYLRRHGIVDD